MMRYDQNLQLDDMGDGGAMTEEQSYEYECKSKFEKNEPVRFDEI
jgi:hypothetical protein